MSINLDALLRTLHVLGVVIWIGGVAMVTAVILPAVKASDDPGRRLELFRRIEHRFKPIAQVTTVLVGATGFYLLHLRDSWWMFARVEYWWVHAMVLVWLIFTVLLFVLEPLVIEKQLDERANEDPDAVIERMLRLHWILLILSLVAVFGAVAGAHGWLFFR